MGGYVAKLVLCDLNQIRNVMAPVTNVTGLRFSEEAGHLEQSWWPAFGCYFWKL